MACHWRCSDQVSLRCCSFCAAAAVPAPLLPAAPTASSAAFRMRFSMRVKRAATCIMMVDGGTRQRCMIHLYKQRIPCQTHAKHQQYLNSMPRSCIALCAQEQHSIHSKPASLSLPTSSTRATMSMLMHFILALHHSRQQPTSVVVHAHAFQTPTTPTPGGV